MTLFFQILALVTALPFAVVLFIGIRSEMESWTRGQSMIAAFGRRKHSIEKERDAVTTA